MFVSLRWSFLSILSAVAIIFATVFAFVAFVAFALRCFLIPHVHLQDLPLHLCQKLAFPLPQPESNPIVSMNSMESVFHTCTIVRGIPGNRFVLRISIEIAAFLLLFSIRT